MGLILGEMTVGFQAEEDRGICLHVVVGPQEVVKRNPLLSQHLSLETIRYLVMKIM